MSSIKFLTIILFFSASISLSDSSVFRQRQKIPKERITDTDKLIPIKIGAILPATAFEQIKRQYDKALIDTANNINKGKFNRFAFTNLYKLEAQKHVMALAASPLNVLKTLCDKVLPHNVTAIIYMTNSPVYGSNAASAQYMLQLTGYLGLPVIAWNVDNVGLEQVAGGTRIAAPPRGECERKAKSAARLYRERFPEGPHHTGQTILKVLKRLRETGCVTSRPRVCRPRNVGRKVQPEYVLSYALAHPQSSTKMISENCSLSESRGVWTILNESGAHTYRSTPVQGLLPRDAERRYTWCNFVINNLKDHLTFLADIIWTDDAFFSRNGTTVVGASAGCNKRLP
ncbi:hypothetical protein AVEN_51693-1 [Araneus ventricosus]|uniref:DUF4817 domain-containing protein n=1 Tax=Araneus ventricosus TaxID=182803 RepID=A0A4Y2HRL2_ARAVE|nr:hypothetical protein AVEN_51693-1 [Araneus ventricosus]